jgi:hypothetical protein
MNGQLSGPYTRYHENVERSQLGKWTKPRRVVHYQRSTEPTAERTMSPNAHASAWTVEQVFFDDNTALPGR